MERRIDVAAGLAFSVRGNTQGVRKAVGGDELDRRLSGATGSVGESDQKGETPGWIPTMGNLIGFILVRYSSGLVEHVFTLFK
jgi:hypothetical protein